MGWRVGLNWNVGGPAGVGGGFMGARTMIEASHAEHKVRCHMAFHNWGWYGIAAPGDRIRVEFRVQERPRCARLDGRGGRPYKGCGPLNPRPSTVSARQVEHAFQVIGLGEEVD